MKDRKKGSPKPNIEKVRLQNVILKHFGLPSPVKNFAGPGGFGDETREVNALRARTLWQNGSVRLLDDLIEVTKDAVEGLANDYDLVLRASLASPSLFGSIQATSGDQLKAASGGGKSKVHRIWVTQPDTLGAPLEALTHLLAHSITEQFGEPTAVVTFAGARLSVQWRNPGESVMAAPPVSKNIAYILGLREPEFCHQFFVAPDDGTDPESILGKLYGRFHRIVYLAETLPREMPKQFFGLLYPAVRRRVAAAYDLSGGKLRIEWTPKDEGPFFSSFVTSLTRKPTHEAFATDPVDTEFDVRGGDVPPPNMRESNETTAASGST